MPFHWFVLLAAVAVEIAATAALKSVAAAPTIVAFAPLLLIALSFALLSVALRVIPMAVAYAVWEGLGIVGIAAIGALLFGEDLSPERVLALAAIIGGIVLIERGVEAADDHEVADGRAV